MANIDPNQPVHAAVPDPETVTLVAALLRHVLTIASGVGIYGGAVSDSMLTILASALIGAATVAWSIYQKIRAKRVDYEGSVLSARQQRPVQPQKIVV